MSFLCVRRESVSVWVQVNCWLCGIGFGMYVSYSYEPVSPAPLYVRLPIDDDEQHFLLYTEYLELRGVASC